MAKAMPNLICKKVSIVEKYKITFKENRKMTYKIKWVHHFIYSCKLCNFLWMYAEAGKACISIS